MIVELCAVALYSSAPLPPPDWPPREPIREFRVQAAVLVRREDILSELEFDLDRADRRCNRNVRGPSLAGDCS